MNSITAPTRPAEPDALTVQRARMGDEAAFRSLYEANVKAVYNLALRLCNDDWEAEDLTQETFVAAWRSLRSFRGESAFATWLHRLATRVIWGHIRRSRREVWLELDAALAVASRPVSLVDRLDLERALRALPSGARTVLVLHGAYGFGYAEIAKELDISIGTVKSQLHRARHLLMEHME